MEPIDAQKRVDFRPSSREDKWVKNETGPINNLTAVVSPPLSYNSVIYKSKTQVHEDTENVPLVEFEEEPEAINSSTNEQLTIGIGTALEHNLERLLMEEQKPNGCVENHLAESPEHLEQLVSQEQSLLNPEPPALRKSDAKSIDLAITYNAILKNLRTLFEQYAKLEKSTLWTSNISKMNFEDDDAGFMNLKEFLLFCKDHSISLSGEVKEAEKQLRTLFKLICTAQGVNFEKFITLLKHISAQENGRIGNRGLIEAAKVIEQRSSTPRVSPMTSHVSVPISARLQRHSSTLKTSHLRQNSALEESEANDRFSKLTYQERLRSRKSIMDTGGLLINPLQVVKKNIELSVNEYEENSLKRTKKMTGEPKISQKSQMGENASTSMEKINEDLAQKFVADRTISFDPQTKTFIAYFINRDFHNIKSVRSRSQSLKRGGVLSYREDLSSNLGKTRAIQKESLSGLKSQFRRASSNKLTEQIEQDSSRRPKTSFDCSRLAIALRKPVDKSKENSRINLSKNARIIQHLNSKKRDIDEMRKFDSYHVREQLKVKSTFLRNITWQTINKMKAEDLHEQMNEKVVVDIQPTQKLTDDTTLKYNTPQTQVQYRFAPTQRHNLEHFINYGKIRKLPISQNNSD